MPARLSITEAASQQVEVDLWGDVYVRVPVTRPRKRAIAEQVARLQHLEAQSIDEAEALDVRSETYAKEAGALEAKVEQDKVSLICKLFDLLLSPLDESVTAKPSALIAEKYKTGEISFEEIDRFMDRFGDAVNDERPT